MLLRISLIIISICLLTAIFYPIFYYETINEVATVELPKEKFGFELVDPEMAPESKRSLVMQGYRIMLETKKYASQYSGDKLSCTNCHFSGGNTFGGEKEGLSLVGVTRHYPKKLADGKEFSLQDRIDQCFLRSMNGKSLPHDSQEMTALVAYLEWISSVVPKDSKMPWLGIHPLQSKHEPNTQNGGKLYEIYCAMCHGSDGDGEGHRVSVSYPPVWGENAFNSEAGMNKLPTMAAFLYKNMPYNNPSLSEDESLDIAAFLISKPHPKEKNSDK